MSKEERYMRGEEEFEEDEEDFEDEFPIEAYQPEPAEEEPEDYRSEHSGRDSETKRERRPAREPDYPTQRTSQGRSSQVSAEDMEKTIAASLAREAATMEEPAGAPETDDFEFFDLDE